MTKKSKKKAPKPAKPKGKKQVGVWVVAFEFKTFSVGRQKWAKSVLWGGEKYAESQAKLRNSNHHYRNVTGPVFIPLKQEAPQQ